MIPFKDKKDLIYKENYKENDIVVGTYKGEKSIFRVSRDTHSLYFYINGSKFHYPKDVMNERFTMGKVISSNKENFYLSNDLLSILNSCDIDTEYLSDKNIFSEYNHFEISDKLGMVKMSNLNSGKGYKKTIIKIGRFISKYYTDISYLRHYGIKIVSPGLKAMEKAHNILLMTQSNVNINIKELYGKDITKAYDSNNHVENNYTLVTSCMNNSRNLSLYVNNPNVVKVLTINRFDEKILGRCLIWTTTTGEQIMDKRYVCSDWVEEKFKDIAKERGLIIVNGNEKEISKFKINININNIKRYPYLDTFCFLYLDSKINLLPNFLYKIFYKISKNQKQILSTLRPKYKFKRLRSTSGNYEDENGSTQREEYDEYDV